VDVHIGEMNSTVRAVDPRHALGDEFLDEIVERTLRRLKNEQAAQHRAVTDTLLTRDVPPGAEGGYR